MIRITKAGWIYIGITIFLGISAVNTGNNLVYLIDSALLSLMAVSGFIGKKNITNLSLDILFPERVFSGVPFYITIKLRNNKTVFPSFLLKVEIEDKYLIFPYIDRKSQMEKQLKFQVHERGFFTVKNIKVCSPFPFNFFIRCFQIEKNYRFIVYPKPVKCKLNTLTGDNGKEKSIPKNRIVTSDGEVISIKDYHPGAPLKHIHWKASAKTGKLKIKEFSRGFSKPQIIDFHSIDISDIEKKLSCLTYLTLMLNKKGLPFLFKINNRLYNGLREKENILFELALYGKKGQN